MNISHHTTSSLIEDLSAPANSLASLELLDAQLAVHRCVHEHRFGWNTSLDTPNDEADIDFAPVPPDPTPSPCLHCERPLHDADTALASPFAIEHGLPPHLCLNCTLEELELLAPYTEAEDGMPVVFAALLAA